jgi:DMSO/TMAO reductase YedYZ heme-binding membrane subunit
MRSCSLWQAWSSSSTSGGPARAAIACDRLLMIFPLVYVVGHLYIYIAKFELYFSVDAAGLTQEGLPVGNLIAVGMAMIGSLTITFLSHPAD